MRRHRYPRYAPESLERKLHPSGLVGIPVAAEVFIPNTQDTAMSDPTSTSSLDVIPPGPMAGTQYATATTLEEPAPAPSAPGSPEPTSPVAPTGGTDPAPPDGDGNPPIGYPSTPGGPGLPAYA